MDKNIENQRKIWSKVAKENGWYKEPFFVQIWMDKETKEIKDSVSFVGLNEDLFVDCETDQIIKQELR